MRERRYKIPAECAAHNQTCVAERRRLHLAAGVSLATSCVALRDACVVGERVVLTGGTDRTEDVQHLVKAFGGRFRDYVWGHRMAKIGARGTFSALGQEPQRYCAINSTLEPAPRAAKRAQLSGSGHWMRCTGDADEGDAKDHWIDIDPAATRAAIENAAVSAIFHTVIWPVYPQSFTETFANVVLPLHELLRAGWLRRDAQLIPHAGWFVDTWIQPFSDRRVYTLQQLGLQAEARCFRSGAVCHLGSFQYDERDGAGVGGPARQPWEAMQYIARALIGGNPDPDLTRTQTRTWTRTWTRTRTRTRSIPQLVAGRRLHHGSGSAAPWWHRPSRTWHAVAATSAATAASGPMVGVDDGALPPLSIPTLRITFVVRRGMNTCLNLLKLLLTLTPTPTLTLTLSRTVTLVLTLTRRYAEAVVSSSTPGSSLRRVPW